MAVAIGIAAVIKLEKRSLKGFMPVGFAGTLMVLPSSIFG